MSDYLISGKGDLVRYDIGYRTKLFFRYKGKYGLKVAKLLLGVVRLKSMKRGDFRALIFFVP
jgi:hypothetical protein